MRHSSAKKVALVTGCRSGFGRIFALRLRDAGYSVYACVRDPREDDGLSKETSTTHPGMLHVMSMDVRDRDSQKKVVDVIMEQEGCVDVLVNNAGVTLAGFTETVDEDEMRNLFDINVFSVFSLTNLVLPHMRKARSGHIVNISSVAGLAPLPGLGLYASSKFAVEGMTEALRHEMRPFGVKVSLIEPGAYATDIFSRNKKFSRRVNEIPDYEAMMKRMVELYDNSEYGNPNEIADLLMQIIASPHPKLRHPKGPNVKKRLWVRALPFGADETVLKKIIGF